MTLDPPEYPEIDAEAWLRERGCANCGGTVWREEHAATGQVTATVWTCAAEACDDPDEWTEDDIAQALDDDAEAARDDAADRRIDEMREERAYDAATTVRS